MADKNIKRIESLWKTFAQKNQLSPTHLDQFKQYYDLLIEWSTKINLTTITELSDVITYHFEDSLTLGGCMSLTAISALADVGTGAGFPLIPLMIKYPHLAGFAIEVNHKKINFIEHVARTLRLEKIECIDLDWRTFLRQTDFSIDLFCARASLQVEELVRLFKPTCPYKTSDLVYWAVDRWKPSDKIKPFLQKECRYQVGDRKRKLVFLAQP